MIAINLAAAFFESSKRVCLADLDPQQSVTQIGALRDAPFPWEHISTLDKDGVLSAGERYPIAIVDCGGYDSA
jgi:cellulose biosynthesis protein BcsQ